MSGMTNKLPYLIGGLLFWFPVIGYAEVNVLQYAKQISNSECTSPVGEQHMVIDAGGYRYPIQYAVRVIADDYLDPTYVISHSSVLSTGDLSGAAPELARIQYVRSPEGLVSYARSAENFHKIFLADREFYFDSRESTGTITESTLHFALVFSENASAVLVVSSKDINFIGQFLACAEEL